MRTLLQDVRYSLRQLRKTPGFTLTAIISLTLGIGATTAVFSVVYAILMDPYPYATPDRMAHMRAILPERTRKPASASPRRNGRSSVNPRSSKTHSWTTTGALP